MLGWRDHIWAGAVRCYRDRRVERVESALGFAFSASFRAFCEVWVSRYDWEDPSARTSYLSLSAAERRLLFRRFIRECRLWERALDLGARTVDLPIPLRDADPGPEGSWRRRLREIRDQEDRMRSFWQTMAKQTGRETRSLGLPWEVRDAFTALGLPAGSELDDVRRAYRRLAMEHHPDRQGDHLRMADLNRAYRRILDHYGN